MENQNFYRPPQADLTTSPSSASGITPRMIGLLSKTRPWVLLIAVLGLIATGLMVAVALVMAVVAAVGGGGSLETVGMGVGMGLVYLLIAVIYFFPCWFLLKYAGAIRKLVGGGGAVAMEEALERQYSFWRLIGVLTVVMMAIYAVILVVVVIAAIAASAGG